MAVPRLAEIARAADRELAAAAITALAPSAAIRGTSSRGACDASAGRPPAKTVRGIAPLCAGLAGHRPRRGGRDAVRETCIRPAAPGPYRRLSAARRHDGDKADDLLFCALARHRPVLRVAACGVSGRSRGEPVGRLAGRLDGLTPDIQVQAVTLLGDIAAPRPWPRSSGPREQGPGRPPGGRHGAGFHRRCSDRGRIDPLLSRRRRRTTQTDRPEPGAVRCRDADAAMMRRPAAGPPGPAVRVDPGPGGPRGQTRGSPLAGGRPQSPTPRVQRGGLPRAGQTGRRCRRRPRDRALGSSGRPLGPGDGAGGHLSPRGKRRARGRRAGEGLRPGQSVAAQGGRRAGRTANRSRPSATP